MRTFVFMLLAVAAVTLGRNPPVAAAAQGSTGSRSAASPVIRTEERAYPTGDRATSVLLLQRLTPVDVRRGEAFSYEIRMTNLTRARVSDVTLTEELPGTFMIASIDPQPTQKSAKRATWNMKDLAGGAAETIRVTGSTDQPNELTWCATVTFSTVVCAKTKIVEPKLALTKTQPPAVLLCDEIPIRFIVTNTGDGVARRIMIDDKLPAGLTTKDGRDGFTLDAGDLAAGQSRQFTVAARASKIGDYSNTARATEQGGLTAESTASTRVQLPVLTIEKRGPTMRYVGRPADFEITVRNTGDAPAENTVLTDALPPGCRFLTADSGGDIRDGRIMWALGTLAPQASKTVKLSLEPTQIGSLTNRASARAICAEATTQTTLDVRGIPGILLECEDDPDPVEVGTNTTYTIVVTNQGSAAATNVKIECTVPPGEEYVGAVGPTRASQEGAAIRFAPLPSLPPKAKANYKVTLRGVKTADVRFRAVLTSDQTDSPVEETESTHIYE